MLGLVLQPVFVGSAVSPVLVPTGIVSLVVPPGDDVEPVPSIPDVVAGPLLVGAAPLLPSELEAEPAAPSNSGLGSWQARGPSNSPASESPIHATGVFIVVTQSTLPPA